MSSFIQVLPTELTHEIIGYLDNYSVITALKVWPELQRRALLVTDHVFHPMFFELEGIQRKYIKKKFRRVAKKDVYNAAVDRADITLIECAYYTKFPLIRPEKPPSNKKDVVSLDDLTFMFIRVASRFDIFALPEVGKLIERLDQDSCPRVKYTVGGETWHHSEFNFLLTFSTVESYARAVSRGKTLVPSITKGSVFEAARGPLEFVALKTLRVEGVSFTNVDLPVLEVLTVVFPYDNGQRYEISGISAPYVVRFSVIYNGVFPVMKDLDNVATTAPYPLDCHYDTRNRYLEISNIQSLQVNRDHRLYDCRAPPLSDYTLKETVDLEFVKRFNDIHFQGMPTVLIEAALTRRPDDPGPQDEISMMRYEIALDIQLGHGPSNSFYREPIRPFRNLSSIMVRVLGENIVLPEFIKQENAPLEIYVHCFGSGTDCSGMGSLLKGRTRSDIFKLVIYNSLSAVHRSKGFNHANLKWIRKDLTAALRETLDARLSGFTIPFLTDEDTGVPGFVEGVHVFPCDKLITSSIRPVVRVGVAERVGETATRRLCRARYEGFTEMRHFEWPKVQPIEWPSAPERRKTKM